MSPAANTQLPAATSKLDQLYEFDREPVAPDHQLGPLHFIGAFSGEHVAATEFVIGALFVNWGASVRDIFLGLLVGNLLAVLSWTLICAPIAVQTRLTLYWYLRRIGGPGVTLIYNLVNALLFSVLAGCMITVSASAVRIPFGVPAQVHWYPDDGRFIAVVLAVGAVVVTLAALGFKSLAAFATVCSPWMLLMFVAGALVVMPRLIEASGVGSVNSPGQFLEMCSRVVWTGRTPDGSEPIGFAKVLAFAWICNLAMHAGLSDMALFRYARKAHYGLASACGMFLGHYLAWICSGLMGAGVALLLQTPLSRLDSGEVAYQSLGWAGILAVVFAGWTTSNPTLYRAGLALQAITPDWSRVKVTIVTGVLTTVIACFPFVFTRLLDFVGLYGLLLSPAGAIVIAEHWLFPRLGLTQYWSTRKGQRWNRAALISWAAAVGLALVLEGSGTLHLFFLFVPVFSLTLGLYVALAWVMGAKEDSAELAPEPPSRHMARPVSGGRAAGNRPLQWTAGLMALACLVACLMLPASVALGGDAASIRTPLLVATVLYLVSGTVFYRLWQA